ncbi:MAG: hypothetical protein AAGJ46_01140 [Planctomycetota bacterium]
MTPSRAAGATTHQPNPTVSVGLDEDEPATVHTAAANRQEVRRLRHRLLKMIIQHHQQRQLGSCRSALARDAG